MELETEPVEESDKNVVNFVSDHSDILTKEEFEEYYKICVQTAIDKYQQLFSVDLNWLRVRKALHACKIFDTLYLQYGTSHYFLFRMIDELAHLNFEDFDESFLWKTKKKFPTLLALVHEMHYNFEGEDAQKEEELK